MKTIWVVVLAALICAVSVAQEPVTVPLVTNTDSTVKMNVGVTTNGQEAGDDPKMEKIEESAPKPEAKPEIEQLKLEEPVKEPAPETRVYYPAGHPATKLGHHAGAGHEKVVQEVASWGGASTGYVDDRDTREIDARRQADADLGKRIDTAQGRADDAFDKAKAAEKTAAEAKEKAESTATWLPFVIIIAVLAGGLVVVSICIAASRR